MNVLILGGAGFIGSSITERFIDLRNKITVIDGLLPKTGGRRKNLEKLNTKIITIFSRIEKINNLKEIVIDSDIIIDCMASTSHLLGIENPLYDLKLNVESHLHLISHLQSGQKVIFLGSSSQFGRRNEKEIKENSPMLPSDIQGVHKVAAESYYRIYSKIKKFNVASLRFPNCFGENQVLEGMDVGLIGNFIKNILNDKVIELYEKNRKRSIIYVKDIAEIVYRICKKNWEGFEPFNIGGEEIKIEKLAELIVNLNGKGRIVYKVMPKKIKAIELGSVKINEKKIEKFIGKIELSNLKESLQKTIKYFEENNEW